MHLTISGYSTALFSTFFFIDEWKLLLDGGDGISAHLNQKSAKIKHVFISHADRDHLGGLFQFTQLNARPGGPEIYYPKDCGSFPAMANFTAKFDPHVGLIEWKPIEHGASIPIRSDLVVKALRNNHVPAPEGQHKSFSYIVQLIKKKLKPEFAALPPSEIVQLRQAHGEEHLTAIAYQNLLGYSADTPVDGAVDWEGTHTLIHEATFLDKQDMENRAGVVQKHSVLEEVIRMVAQTNIKRLVLSHFSTRYAHEQIDERIVALGEQYQLQIPVYRILPGVFVKDILKQTPVYVPEVLI